jgi:glycosyltransferase involved in cell wall biosynthesis
MAAPALSVIVATKDRPALLADALASVVAQSAPPLEVRIGDDGEVPASEKLPERAMLELTVVHGRFGQPGATRNAAVAGARGDVLAFLDDDDRWRPDHLAGFAAAFLDPATEFAWRDCEVVREELRADGTRVPLARTVIACDWDDELMRTNDYLPPSGWAVRRSLFDALGGFDETFGCSEDWDFVLRAAARTRPRRVPGVTVEVRLRGEGNASADFGPERIECLNRLAARHGLPPLEPRTFWEVAHAMGARA